MAIQNGNNAYQIRYEGNTAEKRVYRRPAVREKPVVREAPRKHIRPNMTVKLNRKRETKPSFAPRPAASNARSLNPAQKRIMFAAVFIFGIIICYFVYSVVCRVQEHELDHEIEQSRIELEELKNDYTGLKIAQETQWSDAAVQEYAENILGMQKRNNHQIFWFEVPWDNDFED